MREQWLEQGWSVCFSQVIKFLPPSHVLHRRWVRLQGSRRVPLLGSQRGFHEC